MLIQSFINKFDLSEIRAPKTLAIPGTTLHKYEQESVNNSQMQQDYRMGVGKLLHLTRWT